MSTLSEAASTIEQLGARVAAERARRGVSLRAAGEQSQVSHTIIDRLERGGTPNAITVVKMLRWLDSDPAQ